MVIDLFDLSQQPPWINSSWKKACHFDYWYVFRFGTISEQHFDFYMSTTSVVKALFTEAYRCLVLCFTAVFSLFCNITFSFLTFLILLYILSFSWRDASAHLSKCPLYGVETVYIDR